MHCLHCRLTARRSWVRFPHGVLLALGGRSCTVLRWATSRAFLCGVCMFSPCSQGVSSTKNPNRKRTCKRTGHSCPSLTETDGSLHLVPGRLKAAHCSWGPGGRTVRDGKMQSVNSQRPQACVCVCVLCRLHISTCVLQCVACANKI